MVIINQAFNKLQYFHGAITTTDAEKILENKKEGSFLLRESQNKESIDNQSL